MKNRKIKKYKAMSFIEALISIMIAGIASVILMRIAATALKEALQNERIDQMTQYAVEGANMVKSIIVKASPPMTFETVENCYIPITEGNEQYSFYTTSGQFWKRSVSEVVEGNIVKRDIIEENIPKIGENSDFFRIACIKKEQNEKYLIVRIGVAHIPSQGNITTEKEIKDYFYTTTINL